MTLRKVWSAMRPSLAPSDDEIRRDSAGLLTEFRRHRADGSDGFTCVADAVGLRSRWRSMDGHARRTCSAPRKDHLWLHFTRHVGVRPRAGRRRPVIVRGEGAYLYDATGQALPRRAWPGCSSPSSATAAPSSPRRPPSRPRSSRSCRCGPTRTRPAIELAEKVASYAPGDLNRVFFTTGGGEAVETAWKLAKNYFKLIGKPLKHKVISRAIAYHGTTQGALSITGLPGLKQQFEPLVPSTFRVPNTNFYRAPTHAADDLEAFGRWAADQIAVAIENEGPDTVAAVFLEPVQNAGGCFPPPPGYFQRVREICDEYDVLLVSDEVDLRVRPARATCSAPSATATSPTSSPAPRASPPATPRSAR